MLALTNSLSGRFPPRVLSPLIDAGWRAGRQWEPELLQAFEERINIALPLPALNALSEFGGLNIDISGGLICFGDVEVDLCTSLMSIEKLLGEPLYPIGWTANIFQCDVLSVLMDRSGRVYVDGDTGYDPPRDYRLDLIETNIDRFLKSLFSRRRIPLKQTWYYSVVGLERDQQNQKECEQDATSNGGYLCPHGTAMPYA
jgi:hypothetical protein